MFLCFEADEKRSAFPESSLISMDENGFTVRSFQGSRPGSNLMFYRMDSFQGACQSFQQALAWIRRMPQKQKAT